MEQKVNHLTPATTTMQLKQQQKDASLLNGSGIGGTGSSNNNGATNSSTIIQTTIPLTNGNTSGSNNNNGSNTKQSHAIPSDILDDLASRFIINSPIDERNNLIRLCFQIELAHWFYLDFFCEIVEKKLIPCGIKQFTIHLFQVC